jgi:hypothetical protein
VFFKRTFDPIHAVAVPVGHRSDNPVIAWSRVTKKPIWNARHHLTNIESAHRPLPPNLDSLWYIPFFIDV